MRKMAVVFILMFVILVLIAVLMTQSLVVMQRIAHVSNVEGRVQIQSRSAQQFQPLGDKEFVKTGDTLSTGPQSSLALNWIDGTRICVGPSTVLTVLQCQINKSTDAETSVFKLNTGQIWIRIIRVLSQQSKFEIRTPTATAGVRGTIFSVKVTDGVTEISVYDGTVSVQSASGAVEVTENKSLALMGGAPQVVQFSAADRQAWEGSLADLGPYLEIEQPRPQQAVSGDSVTVTGRCEQGAQLTINDQPVTLKPKGRFSLEIPVPSDQPTFTIQAVATAVRGRTTTVTRELQTTVQPPTD